MIKENKGDEAYRSAVTLASSSIDWRSIKNNIPLKKKSEQHKLAIAQFEVARIVASTSLS